ncbi:MAG: hypothetical protein R3A11_00250 [Bdellovibrionota bacterium]
MLRELKLRNELNLFVFEGKNKMVRFDFDPKEVPTNIQSLIASRFDALGPKHKTALHWLAVFGIEEDTDEAEVLLEDKVNIGKDTLKELFDLHYLRESSFFPRRLHRFHHELTYEIVFEQMSEKEKEKINFEIANWMEKKYAHERFFHIDRIAKFYMKGPICNESFQAAYEAGEKAFEQNRFLDAKMFYEYMQRVKETLPTHENVLTKIYPRYVESLISSGNTLEAEKVIQEWTMISHLLNTEEHILYLKLNIELLKTKKEFSKLNGFIQRHSDFIYSIRSIHEEDYFQIKLEHCESMFFTADVRQSLHESLKLLRGLNPSNLDKLKAKIWCFIATILSHLNDDHLSEDLLKRSIKHLEERKNTDDYILLLRRITSFYQAVKCDYREAIRYYDMAIEHCNEAGLFKDLLLLKFGRSISKIFSGDYISSLEDLNFAAKESSRLDNTLFFQNSCYWMADLYLALGDIETADTWISKTSQEIVKDWFVDYKRLHVLADKAFCEKSYSEASYYFDKAAKIFQTNNNMKSYEYFSVFSIICRALGQLENIHDLCREFNELYLNNLDHKYRITWFFQIGALFLAAHGGEPVFKPKMNWDPMDCNAVFLRQLMFVAKIQWLQSIGKKDKAKKLAQEYKKHRDRLSDKIPEDHREIFLRHPLYAVPEI